MNFDRRAGDAIDVDGNVGIAQINLLRQDRDVEFEIEFGLIKEIRKNSYRSATVVLKDGREFRLRGSNDVDEDNDGIFVDLDDGEDVIIDWDEFDRLELSKK